MTDFNDFRWEVTWGKHARFRFNVQLGGVDETVLGWTRFWFTARRAPGALLSLIACDYPGGGMSIVDQDAGLIEVEIVPEQTTVLVNRYQEFYGDLAGLDGEGRLHDLGRGLLVFLPAITTESG